MDTTTNCSCVDSAMENITQTWISDVMLPLVGFTGIIGNFCAAIVLVCPEMKSTFHQSLLTLALCDILFISSALIEHFTDTSSPTYVLLFPYVWNPLKNILMSWETYLIMSIATERFAAICKPLCYRAHKLSHSSKVHLLTFVFPSVIASILLNIPKFFETHLVSRNETNGINGTVVIIDYEATDLRLHPDYIFYYTHFTRFLLTGLLPVVFLSIINIAICIKIKKSQKFSSFSSSSKFSSSPLHDSQRALSNRSSSGYKQRCKKSKNSAVTLSTVVIMYIICNGPRLLLNLSEYIIGDELYEVDSCNCSLAPDWFFILIRISHLFLAINSSANFLIYFSVCQKFKTVCMKRLRNLIHSTATDETENDLF